MKDDQMLTDMWVFPRIMVPQNGWFISIRANPIKMDDFGNTHVYCIFYSNTSLGKASERFDHTFPTTFCENTQSQVHAEATEVTFDKRMLVTFWGETCRNS